MYSLVLLLILLSTHIDDAKAAAAPTIPKRQIINGWEKKSATYKNEI